MKHLISLCLCASVFNLPAAVPLRWTVETSRAVPAQFEAYQGETLAIEAALQSYGKPLEAPSNYSLYWQTNGMGNAYWSAPCTVPTSSLVGAPTNVLFATWSPTNDVGAKVYNCFIGQPGTIYHAAFQLRLRPSPGATPNELPLPQKVIDFAKVRVLNPPWSGGVVVVVDTNAVVDIIHKTVEGSARTLPPYLHYLEMDDTYPDAAAEWYAQRGSGILSASCSSVRDGGFLCRNYDWNFDFMPEFVVRVPAIEQSNNRTIPGRFASLAVCNVGTNLTESDVVSGKWSKWYKALPGRAVDGINENGVACNINVVDGDPQTSGWHTTGDLHPLAAVRWILDHATNAQHGAEYIAANIRFPQGWQQNYHYMVADSSSTYIVENGTNYLATGATGVPPVAVLTNFRLYPSRSTTGEGQERYDALMSGESITSQWWTLTYTAAGYRQSDLPGITGSELTELFNYWENNPRESHRGESFNGTNWWQTVHTSIYDLKNLTLKIAVQEIDDWYTFAVPSAGGVKPETVREIVEPMIGAATNGIPEQISSLQDGKLDKTGGIVTGNLHLADDEDPIEHAEIKFARHGNIAARVDISAEPDSAGSAELILIGSEGGARIHVFGTTESPASIKKDGVEVRGGHDNTCHKTELGEWTKENDIPAGVEIVRVWKSDSFDGWTATFRYNGVEATEDTDNIYGDDATRISFWSEDFFEELPATHWHLSRSAVCTTGEKFTTQGYVTNAVSSAVSTNNPAFVFAVRSVSPPPDPNLRLYDEIRQCWWIGRMVNGVINWEVE